MFAIFPQGTLKKDGSLMGSLKRLVGGVQNTTPQSRCKTSNIFLTVHVYLPLQKIKFRIVAYSFNEFHYLIKRLRTKVNQITKFSNRLKDRGRQRAHQSFSKRPEEIKNLDYQRKIWFLITNKEMKTLHNVRDYIKRSNRNYFHKI